MYDTLKSVIRHFAVYGFGTILNRIIGFLLIPVYTHYLTTSDYGTLELIELTTYVAGMFLSAGISYSVLRFYYDSDHPADRRLVVSTAHVATLAIAALLGVWLVVFSPGISNLVFGLHDHVELFRIAFVTLVLAVASEVPMVYLRAQQKSVLYTAISVVRLGIGLGLNILFLVVFGWGIRGIILSGFITQALATAFGAVYTFARTGFRISVPRLKEMIAYGLPHIPGAVSLYVLNFADRYLLQRFSNMSQVGIYALGYKFGMVISPLLTEPFMAIWSPKMFEIARQDNARDIYSAMLTYFLFLEMWVGLGISVLIKDVLSVISSPEYHSAYQVVPIIVLSYMVWGACYHVRVGILLAKQTKYVAYVLGAGAVCNLLLNAALIPPWGLWGAASATLGSYLLVFFLSHRISMRFLSVRYEFGRIFKMMAVAVALYALSRLVEVRPLALGLGLKAAWVMLFPLGLALTGFYSGRERSKLRELTRSAWQFAVGKSGGGARKPGGESGPS